MKLGIMSDSHGRVGLVQDALSLLRAVGAEAVVHCGDVGGLPVLDALAGWRCWFVWGNTDVPEPAWQRYLTDLGIDWPVGPLSIRVGHRRIAVFHGHESSFPAALRAAEHHYLFHGHTHRAEDYRVGPMRVVNPGALHRVAIPTVALLDLATDEVCFHEVNGRQP